jgi:hypothetical protein
VAFRRFLKSRRIQEALLKIGKEFIHVSAEITPRQVPLPARQSDHSCPHSYPLFYEPLV